MQGALEFGTTRAVREALAAHPTVRTVRLESRGGRVAEGLALGRLLVDRDQGTLVTGECSSACVTAFVGGNRRLIGPGRAHRTAQRGRRRRQCSARREANRRSDAFMVARGVDAHVLALGAATANDDIWFPTQAVLLASGLATERAGP